MILGDRGNDVIEVQDFLIEKHFLNEREENYGVKTKLAVIRLQRLLGVTETGEWSDIYYKLYELKAPLVRATGAAAATETTATGTGTTVTSSSNPKGNASFTTDYITCYIYNLNTGTQVNFGVSTPDEISDSNSANFEDQAVKGRSSPFKAYDSSGPRTISFTVELVADYCSEGIVKTVNKLRALVYPHKQTVIVEPRCKVCIGNFLQVTGVPTNIDVTWKKPYKDGIYTLADVSITVSEVEDAGRFSKEVEGS